MLERRSWRCVPSPQSTRIRSPPRRMSVAAGPRRAVGTDPDVPRKTRSRSIRPVYGRPCCDRLKRTAPRVDNRWGRAARDAGDAPGRGLRARRLLTGHDDHLPRAQGSPLEVVRLAKPPDSLARVAAVTRRGNRPERVTGLHDVPRLRSRPDGRVRRPQRTRNEKCQGDSEENETRNEHVFPQYRTHVRVSNASFASPGPGAEALDDDELRNAVPDHDHRVRGRAATFGRASGVHDPRLAGADDLGEVRVAVRDHFAAREPADEPFRPAGRKP